TGSPVSEHHPPLPALSQKRPTDPTEPTEPAAAVLLEAEAANEKSRTSKTAPGGAAPCPFRLAGLSEFLQIGLVTHVHVHIHVRRRLALSRGLGPDGRTLADRRMCYRGSGLMGRL